MKLRIANAGGYGIFTWGKKRLGAVSARAQTTLRALQPPRSTKTIASSSNNLQTRFETARTGHDLSIYLSTVDDLVPHPPL